MVNDNSTKIKIADLKLRDLIASVPLFSGFPEPLIDNLVKVAEIRRYDPENVILHQGDLNKSLYFLWLGEVDIYVDDGLVANMRRKGDLLGEMSVITSQPCSAKIVAKTQVELIRVNIEDYRSKVGENHDQFDHFLYRVYSKILTEKVILTNQKAKRVEETLEALQKAKNELVDINSQMERRVVERTQSIQSRLKVLLDFHLKSLHDNLSQAVSSADTIANPEQEQLFKQSLHEVNEVVRFLEPIVNRFDIEVSLKTKKVLLAQSERKAQTMSKMALGGTGMSIESTVSVDDAFEKLITNVYNVVLVDADSLHLVEAVEKLNRKPKVIFVANKSIKENLQKLVALPQLPNIVFISEEDRAASIRAITTAVAKICGPNIFGLEKYLAVGVEVKDLAIKSSTERQMLNEKMREHFVRLGVRGSILDQVSSVLEELLMNAIYDAPTDKKGRPIYNMLERTEKVELKPQEQGVFRFATDGTLVAISVEDPFGALTAKIIMKYLESCYGGQAGVMQSEKGGAGRGLHMIIENSLFVVFNINPGKQTEVIAFFNVVPGSKEVLAPMMHYFVE
ncbi:MAG: cyclic nucleotide-binding domain-containing protein [Bdellovibrionales bacterium]